MHVGANDIVTGPTRCRKRGSQNRSATHLTAAELHQYEFVAAKTHGAYTHTHTPVHLAWEQIVEVRLQRNRGPQLGRDVFHLFCFNKKKQKLALLAPTACCTVRYKQATVFLNRKNKYMALLARTAVYRHINKTDIATEQTPALGVMFVSFCLV